MDIICETNIQRIFLYSQIFLENSQLFEGSIVYIDLLLT